MKGTFRKFVEYDDRASMIYTCRHCESTLFGLYKRKDNDQPVSACAGCGNVGDLLDCYDDRHN